MSSSAEDYQREADIPGNMEEVKAGRVCSTYRIENEEEYFLQFSEEHPEHLKIGVKALDMLEETDIPVPEKIYSRIADPFVITRSVSGEPLRETENESVYRKAGETLGKIHQQTFDHYGRFHVFGPELGLAGKKDWSKAFSNIYSQAMHNASELISAPKAQSIDQFYYENKENLPGSPEKSLLHFDYDTDNIMFQNGEITGVIDWDRIRVGDSAFELVKTSQLLKRQEKPVQPFVEGYNSVNEIEMSSEAEEIYKLVSEVGRLSELHFMQENHGIDPSENDLEHTVTEIDRILDQK